MGLYEKFKKSLKRGLKTWTRCNWPELSKYCGCCELSTGIYIRCIATVVVTTGTTIFICFLLASLIQARKRIRNADMSTLEELLEGATDSEQTDLNGVFMILDGVVAYFVLWTNFKFLYIIRNLCTIYAVYTKSARFLKVLLYIGVPSWIFDGFLSIIGNILLRYIVNGLLFFNFMFEGYNLLAIHSKYKELSGKSRKVKDFVTPSAIIGPNTINACETPVDTSNEPHCITCKCYDRYDDNNNNCSHNLDNATATPVTVAPTFAEIAVASNSNATKSEDTLNFKDSPIIFNQEILQGAQSVMAAPSIPINEENMPKEKPQRPNTLAIRPLQLKKEKIDLCDTPVIYDEGQLNIGMSPIIERL